MSTRAIKKKRPPVEGTLAGDWQPPREQAPSVVRADQPSVARYLALAGLFGICVGGLALLVPISFLGNFATYLVSPAWGVILLSAGLCLLLYHAFTDKDVQFRRLYGLLGLVLVLVGFGLRVIPGGGEIGAAFLPFGAPCTLVALLFLLIFARNEADEQLKSRALFLVAGVGVIHALIGFIGGFISENFLLGNGVVHLILGLLYLWGYIGLEGGTRSDRGYLAGRLLAFGGLAVAAAATTISLLYQFRVIEAPAAFSYFMPRGLVLIYLGLEYFILGFSITSDWQIVVLTRRELQSFFFSPIAYIVIIGLTLVGWLSFYFFVSRVVVEPGAFRSQPLPEPIFYYFAANFFPIICLIFMVPILTMRLLSEEWRSGTLEVLLTAPVNEWSVVLSKYLAVLRFFLLCWYPWGMFFVALRVEGGQPFDYRPILTFLISLMSFGAGFLAMGLYNSSLTKNQIVAAVLTFSGMMFWTLIFFLKGMPLANEGTWLGGLVDYIAYIQVWLDSAQGVLQPRKLLFHLSAAVFWVFLSIKVVESRKWS